MSNSGRKCDNRTSVHSDGMRADPPSAASCDAEFISAVESFLDSPHRVLLLEGQFGQSMAKLVGLAGMCCSKAPRTVVAPASRIASRYPNTESLSIFGLLYSANPEFCSREKKYVHQQQCNCDDRDQVYIIGDAHLISDSHWEIVSRRFGSGKLLDDLMEFADLSGSRRQIIFIRDLYQLLRGKEGSTALSQQSLERYTKSVKHAHLANYRCNQAPPLMRENGKRLAARIRTGRFIPLRIACDITECVQLPGLSGDVIENIGNSDAKVIAYTHRQVNSYNALIRKRVFGRGKDLMPGDLIVSHSHLKFQCETCARTYTAPNGSFGKVKSIGEEFTITQPLKGRPEPVKVKFLRVRIRWNPGCCNDAPESLCFKEFLYGDKPELKADHWIALVAYARGKKQETQSRNPDRSDDTDGDSRAEATAVRAADEDEDKTPDPRDPLLNAAQIRFGYSFTLHRAQGCQFETIIADLSHEHNLGGTTYLRWLYTVFTVSSRMAYLFNVPRWSPFDNTAWEFDASPHKSSIQPSSLIDYDPHAGDPEDLAELPTEKRELRNLLRFIITRMDPIDARVTNIAHHNYQEVYTFELAGGGTCTMQFYYNGKFEVTRIAVRKSQPPGCAETVRDALASEPAFENSLQEEMCSALLELIGPAGMKVTSVEHRRFQEVYFVKGLWKRPAVRILQEKRRCHQSDPEWSHLSSRKRRT